MFKIKIITLAEKILKSLANQYKKIGKSSFLFSDIKAISNASDEHLRNAILMLEKDGFVNVFFADNIPFMITLLPDGIRNCEENTWLKKSYSLMKEIKTFLD